MKNKIILIFSLFVLSVLNLKAAANTFKVNQIAFLSINSAITPATLDYLNYQLNRLPKDSLAVIKLNTPGGLVTTTKDIITLFGKQNYPIAVWIGPEGASAASAGAIIASAAHFILMSPATNMGAATPIGMGEDIKESDTKNKAINDLMAQVRSLAQSRGRPAGPFEDMIKSAKSFTDKESLNLKIIDGIISRSGDLSSVLNGKSFKLLGESYILKISDIAISYEYGPTLGQKVLEVLANPTTAYILFLIGIALLYFELQAPGGYIAGSIGLGLLILAGISFQVLPLNWGALGLILLGVILLALEVFITSYGLLAIAGLISFVMGSLFLFHGEGGLISIEYTVIISALAGVITAMGLLAWYLYHDKKKQKRSENFFAPEGAKGSVIHIDEKNKLIQVKVRGEIWNAKGPTDIITGDSIEVIGVDQEHLLLQVKKV